MSRFFLWFNVICEKCLIVNRNITKIVILSFSNKKKQISIIHFLIFLMNIEVWFKKYSNSSAKVKLIIEKLKNVEWDKVIIIYVSNPRKTYYSILSDPVRRYVLVTYNILYFLGVWRHAIYFFFENRQLLKLFE